MAIPLRESFSVPFLWGQILCIHLYMNNKVKDKRVGILKHSVIDEAKKQLTAMTLRGLKPHL